MNARAIVRSPAVLALLGGTLFALSGPPFPAAFSAAAWLGVSLLAVVLDRAPPLRALLRGLLFGVALNLIVLVFVPATITRFTELPRVAAYALWILLAAGQGSIWALAGLVTALAKKARVPLVSAFPLGVAASMLAPQLFSWTIATPLGRAPLFLQLAEVIGERGVSILIAVFAALAARAWSTTERREIDRQSVARGNARARASIAALAIPLLLLSYGVIRKPAIEARLAAAPHRTIGLVQQAVPPKDRWNPDLHEEILHTLWGLTREAQAKGATLAVWPEAAYPWILRNEGGVDAGPQRIRGPGIEIDVLTGLLTAAPPIAGDDETKVRNNYNAAVIVTADSNFSPAAAKLELLPFGEAIPFGEQLPFLRRAFARGGGLRPGREVVLLSTKGAEPNVHAGILNCYEDTLPSVSRRLLAAGPNLLVNVTNDAWFGETAEPDLHLLAATARAIEVRRDLVRAVNTGVTAHVDAFGRIVARLPRETRGVLIVTPALLDDPPTIYARFGDLTWGAPLLLAAMIAGLWSRRRRSST